MNRRYITILLPSTFADISAAFLYRHFRHHQPVDNTSTASRRPSPSPGVIDFVERFAAIAHYFSMRRRRTPPTPPVSNSLDAFMPRARSAARFRQRLFDFRPPPFSRRHRRQCLRCLRRRRRTPAFSRTAADYARRLCRRTSPPAKRRGARFCRCRRTMGRPPRPARRRRRVSRAHRPAAAAGVTMPEYHYFRSMRADGRVCF